MTLETRSLTEFQRAEAAIHSTRACVHAARAAYSAAIRRRDVAAIRRAEAEASAAGLAHQLAFDVWVGMAGAA